MIDGVCWNWLRSVLSLRSLWILTLSFSGIDDSDTDVSKKMFVVQFFFQNHSLGTYYDNLLYHSSIALTPCIRRPSSPDKMW